MQRPESERPSLCQLLIKYLEEEAGGSTCLPRHGRALDVACGMGQNAIWLAQRGFEVDAVDISLVGLQRARAEVERLGVSVHFIQADLDEYTPPPATYSVILVRRFLRRRLFPLLQQALAVGGCLFYESFNQRKHISDRAFPDAYLLDDGELARTFSVLHVIESGDDGGRCGEVSWLVAIKT